MAAAIRSAFETSAWATARALRHECARRLGLLDSDDPDDQKAFWEAGLARVRGQG